MLAAVVGALSVPTTLYLGYDLLKGRLSKCDSISRKTSVHLTTEIEFLKVKGKVHLGREKLAELSDRARATADSLKTCCIVLDGGNLN